jgi:hypothetical protein
MSNPRRKKHFIDPTVQGSLARRIIMHWLVFIGVACIVAFVLQVLSDPFRPVAEHALNMWWTHGPFLLVMAFLLPVFMVDTIKLSHRFAGPVYALRRALREIGEGQKPRRLKFRKRDFWHDLADEYNTAMENLEVLDRVPNASPSKELVGSEK